MKGARKRVFSQDSDEDTTPTPPMKTSRDNILKKVSITIHETTSKLLPKFTEAISDVPQATLAVMHPKLDTISDAIESHHNETQYVYQKHNDQARMIAVLNKRVDALQEDKTRLETEKDQLNAEKDTLHRDVRMIQGTALADSSHFFEEIKKEMKKLKRDVKDIKEELWAFRNDMQAILKALKIN